VLLDTNVVSELARRIPHPGVTSFLREIENPQVSVMLFHELVFGMEKAEAAQRLSLGIFVQDMRKMFGADAIPVDMEVSETAARLRAFERKQGRILAIVDSLMAATALVYDMPLATRNVKDFQYLGLRLINPFEA
jgi:toxin FitB